MEIVKAKVKDPYDAKTYTNPASIDSMINLRVFCADYFERNIRNNNTGQANENIENFINLITTSLTIFGRARAVIPELQVPSDVSSHSNPEIQRLLAATPSLRGQRGRYWAILPEESVWYRMTQDGFDLEMKHAGGERWHSASPQSGSKASTSKQEFHFKMNTNAPSFVPKAEVGVSKVVYSPKRGSRPIEPSEAWDEAFERQSAQVSSGQRIPFRPFSNTATPVPLQEPMHTPLPYPEPSQDRYYSANEIKFTQHMQTPPAFHPSTPSKQISKSSRHTSTPKDKYMDEDANLEAMIEQQINQHRRAQDSAHLPSPITLTPNRLPSNRTSDASGVLPDCTGPRMPAYGSSMSNGQGTHSEPSNTHSRFPKAHAFSPYQRNRPSSPYGPPAKAPRLPVYQDIGAANPSYTNNAFQPNADIWGPLHPISSGQHRVQATATSPFGDEDAMIMPAQGSMNHRDYWLLLYRREQAIEGRLGRAKQPISDPLRRHITDMQQVRLRLIAEDNMPRRGKTWNPERLRKLREQLNDLFLPKPGSKPVTDETFAMRMDFEKVLKKEIKRMEWLQRGEEDEARRQDAARNMES